MVEKNNLLFLVLFVSIILFGCHNEEASNEQNKTNSKIDTCAEIFYQFPANIVSEISSELRDCTLIYAFVKTDNDDITSLIFVYHEKSNRAIVLSRKSNRKMKINGKDIPLLFPIDFLFAKEEKDTMNLIQDFNFATFKFDRNGRIVEKLKF